MPLLAPFVILKSTFRIKFLYFLTVTISPPLVDSPPSLPCTFKLSFAMLHPFVGKVLILAPRHPSVVFPSHNNSQPSLISLLVKVLELLFSACDPKTTHK